jgi:hypothetical protein
MARECYRRVKRILVTACAKSHITDIKMSVTDISFGEDPLGSESPDHRPRHPEDIMKTSHAIAALAALAVSTGAATAAETMSHAGYLASVATYKPMQGFNHVVGAKRFVGYFMPGKNVCSVTVMVALADDDRLATPPQRIQVEIPAADRSELAAGGGDALGIACTVDADAIKVAPLMARPSTTASN